jgi:uncharacterized membrane protein YbhN (UPF0104 family)
VSGRRRSVLFFLGKLAVSAGLIAWLLRHIGTEALLAVVMRAAIPSLLMAVLILLSSHALAVWLWGRLLAAADAPLPARRVMAFYFAGAFLNLVLPSAAGGDLARVFGATRESGRGAAVVGATVVERLLGGAVLALLALAALIGANPVTESPHGAALGMVVVANAVLSLGALGLVLSPGGGRLLRALGSALPARAGAWLSRLDDSMVRLRRAQHRWLLTVAALAIHSLRILAHVQVARALDIDLSVRYFFLFVPLLAIVVSLPISIGGLGVREGLGALLFGLVGVGAAEASAMQLLTYMLAAVVSLPGAAALVLMIRRAPAQVKAQTQAKGREL